VSYKIDLNLFLLSALLIPIQSFAMGAKRPSVPSSPNSEVEAAFQKIPVGFAGTSLLSDGKGNPILLVQGIYEAKDPPEWLEPLETLLPLGRPVYFFSWSQFPSLESNRDLMIQGIRKILSDHPGTQLSIVGYSAGGIISLMALDQLVGDPDYSRIKLYTVASPIFGYNAPNVLAFMGAPFVGIGTIEIGIGAYKKLHHVPLQNCSAFVTTECALDKHACEYGHILPQQGSQDDPQEMPCGSDNVTRLDHDTHVTAPGSAIHQIFGI